MEEGRKLIQIELVKKKDPDGVFFLLRVDKLCVKSFLEDEEQEAKKAYEKYLKMLKEEGTVKKEEIILSASI